jgi:hypothetical protein
MFLSSAGSEPSGSYFKPYNQISSQNPYVMLNMSRSDLLSALADAMFDWRHAAKFSFFRVRLLFRCTESETVFPVPKVRRTRAGGAPVPPLDESFHVVTLEACFQTMKWGLFQRDFSLVSPWRIVDINDCTPEKTTFFPAIEYALDRLVEESS